MGRDGEEPIVFGGGSVVLLGLDLLCVLGRVDSVRGKRLIRLLWCD